MNIVRRNFIGLFILVVIFVFSSCQFSMENKDEQERVITESDGLKVILKPGIPEEALSLTLDDYKEKLLPDSKSIHSDEMINISLEQLDVLYNSIKNISDFPELGNLTEKDVNIIRDDFLNISDEEIEYSFDEILNIYKAQLRFEVFQVIDNEGDIAVTTKGGSYAGGLYSDEFWLLFWNPWQISATQKASKEAISITNAKYGKNGWGDKSDAFRHAIWNVLLATYVGGSKSERINWAYRFTTAHETGSVKDGVNSPSWDNPMDFHNNAEGRSYFNSKATERNVWWWKEVTPPAVSKSKADIYDKSQNAVKFVNQIELFALSGKMVYYK